MKSRYLPLLAMLVAMPAAAQQHQHMQGGDHMAAGIRPLHESIRNNIVRAAEQMPEEHYAFKPTPEVRSFGQLIGHITNANYLFCSLASGVENPSKTDHEQTTAKAALVQAVKDSFTFCDKAFQTGDAKLMEKTDVFGQQRDRFYALVMNIAHDNEHYGNIVTYMRMKGLVPPSSQR